MYRKLRDFFLGRPNKPEFKVFIVLYTPEDYVPDIFCYYNKVESSTKKNKKIKMDHHNYHPQSADFNQGKNKIHVFYAQKYCKKDQKYEITITMKSDKYVEYSSNKKNEIIDSNDRHIFFFDIKFFDNNNSTYKFPPCTIINDLQTKIFAISNYLRNEEEKLYIQPFLKQIEQELNHSSKNIVEMYIKFYFTYRASLLTNKKFTMQDFLVLSSLISRMPDKLLYENIQFFNLEVIEHTVARLNDGEKENEKMEFYNETRTFWNKSQVLYTFYFNLEKFTSKIKENPDLIKSEALILFIRKRNPSCFKNISGKDYDRITNILDMYGCTKEIEIEYFLLDICPSFGRLIDMITKKLDKDEKISAELEKIIEKVFLADSTNMNTNFKILIDLSLEKYSGFKQIISRVLQKIESIDSFFLLSELISDDKYSQKGMQDHTEKKNLFDADLRKEILEKTNGFFNKNIGCKTLFERIYVLDSKKKNLEFIYNDENLIKKIGEILLNQKLEDLLRFSKETEKNLLNCSFLMNDFFFFKIVLEKFDNLESLKRAISFNLDEFIKIDNTLFMSQEMVSKSIRLGKNVHKIHLEIFFDIYRLLPVEKKEKLIELFFDSISKLWTIENLIIFANELETCANDLMKKTFLKHAQEKISKQKFSSVETSNFLNQLSSSKTNLSFVPQLKKIFVTMILNQTNLELNIKKNWFRNFLEFPENHLIHKIAKCISEDKKIDCIYINHLREFAIEINFKFNIETPTITYEELKLFREKDKNLHIVTSFVASMLDTKEDLLKNNISILKQRVDEYDNTMNVLEGFMKKYFRDIDESSQFIKIVDSEQKQKILKPISDLLIDQSFAEYVIISKKYLKYDSCTTFYNIYQSLANEEANKDLQDRLKTLNDANESFKAFTLRLQEEKDHSISITVKEFEHVFKGANIEKEIKALEQVLNNKFSEKIRDAIINCNKFLSKKEEIRENITSMLEVIKTYSLRETYTTKDLKESLELLEEQNYNKSIYDFLRIDSMLYKINRSILEYNSRLMRMIRILSKSKPLYDLIKDKDEMSIRRKAENIGEHGEDFITGKTIKDLIQARNFFVELYNEKLETKDDFSLSYLIDRLLNEKKFENVGFSIEDCNKVMTGIVKLFDEKTQEGTSKQKVKECYKYSEYQFIINEKENGYQVKINAGERRTEFDFQEILDARMRSLLLISSANDEEIEEEKNSKDEIKEIKKENPEEIKPGMIEMIEEKSKEIEPVTIEKKKGKNDEKDPAIHEKKKEKLMHQKFVEIIDFIQDIAEKLNSLYFSGHPLIPEITVIIKDGVSLDLDIQNEVKKLTELKEEWKDTLLEAYKDFYPLTLLYGRHFSMFYDYLCKKHIIDSENDLKLQLEYILKNLGADEIQISTFLKESWGKIGIKEFVLTLGKELETLSNKDYPLNKKTAFNNFKIKTGTIVTTQVAASDFENHILSLFINETGTLPHSNQIFFCHPDVKWEWIVTFLHRVYKCTENHLFVLAKVELLPPAFQSKLVGQINIFKQSFEGVIASRLVILSTDPKSLIMIQIKKMDIPSYISELLSNQTLKNHLKGISKRVKVITSEESGYGKTLKIKKFALEEKLDIYSYPIYDDVEFKNLSRRTFYLAQQKSKLIHIWISKVDDTQKLNQYLFNLIILNGSYLYDTLSILDEKVFFYIEISPTYGQSLFNSLKFLHLFEIDVITKKDFQNTPLDVSLSKSSYNYFGNYFLSIGRDPNFLLNNEIVENNLQDLTPDIIKRLLFEHFVQKDENITFYQINSFLNILENQLEKFTKSEFLKFYMLQILEINNKPNQKVPTSVRNTIFKSILGHTRVLVQSSYSQAFIAQASTFASMYPELKGYIKDEKAMNQENAIIGAPKELLIILHEGGSLSVPMITGVQIPNDIADFLATDPSYIDPQSMKSDQISTNYIKTLQRITSNHMRIQNEKYDEAKKFDKNYVVLQDNFYKMVLIYLKYEANIPVIIMGETGCGKTSLVKYLASNILQIRFKIISFHAGITEQKLIKIISEIIEESRNNYTSMWVVLDEVNTCNCLGLVSELLCNRSMLGDNLPENLFFIATCNPYRSKTLKNEQIGLVKKNTRAETGNLAYTVNMLPHNMMNFVFDFGSLRDQDEIEYIKKIIDVVPNRYLKVTSRCIKKSQSFLRDQGETSSVSLREGKRFVKIFEFFRRRIDLNWYDHNIDRNSILLSLFICYYIRLTTSDLRETYVDSISKFWREETNERHIDKKRILEIFDETQSYVLDQIKLAPGIAKNNALKENFFTGIVCLVNKIPLLICGKPGCSKTMAIRLIHENMRGPDSYKPFFRNLPRIFSVSYQGSHSSTSEGIEAVFNRAKKIQKEYSGNDEANFGKVITMVFFDEIGLAEESENNPLKVLHNLLEPVSGDPDDEVGFIGISNWKLDAAKMNRSVFLARPDPDEKELIKTGKEIFQSYSFAGYFQYEIVLDSLAKSYYKLRVNQSKTSFADFHGTRDFYSLIKQVSSEITSKNLKKDIEEIVKDAIERNFGGLSITVEAMKKYFNGFCPRHALKEIRKDNLEIIQSNFEDPEARYLMIITNGNYGTYLLQNHFAKVNKDSHIIVGSRLQDDNNKEEYIFRTLKVISDHMEKGESVILQNLESTYPSLYDLFNQNFEIIDNRKNCRIALASTTNSMRYVDDNFRCIVIVDQQDLLKMDPPFLNRFEKQILILENTMTKDLLLITEAILQNLENMHKSKTGSEYFVSPNRMIGGMGRETVSGLVLKYSHENNNPDEIIEKCFNQLIQLSSMEFIAALSYSEYRDMNPLGYDKLVKQYNETRYFSLEDFIQKEFENDKKFIKKSLIYTYSNILEANEIFKGIQISSYKQERILHRDIEAFFLNKTQSTFILSFEEDDSKHLGMLKSIVERIINEKSSQVNTLKHFIVILNIKKELKTSTHYFPAISDWKQVFIDSLMPNSKIKFNDFFGIPFKDICDKYLAEIEKIQLQKIIGQSYLRLNFTSYEKLDGEVSNYITMIIEKIIESEAMVAIIKSILLRYIKDCRWEDDILFQEKYCNNYETLEETFEFYIGTKIVDIMTKVLWKAENNSMLDFLLYEQDQEKLNYFAVIFNQALQPLLLDIDTINLAELKHENPVSKIWGMKLPYSLRRIEAVIPKLEKISREIFELETDPKSDKKYSDICWKYESQIPLLTEDNLTNHALNLDNNIEIFIQRDYHHDMINYLCQKILNLNESSKYLLMNFYEVRSQSLNKIFDDNKLKLPDSPTNIAIWVLGYESLLKNLFNVFQGLLSLNNEIKILAEDFARYCIQNPKEGLFSLLELTFDFASSSIIPNKQTIDYYKNNLEAVTKILNSLKLSHLDIQKSIKSFDFSRKFDVMVLIRITQIYFKDSPRLVYEFLEESLKQNENKEFKINETFFFNLDQFVKNLPEGRDQIGEKTNIIFEKESDDPIWNQFKSDILVNLVAQNTKNIDNYKKHLNQILENHEFISESSVFISNGLAINEFKSLPLDKHPFIQVLSENLEQKKSIELVISEIISSKFYKLASEQNCIDFLRNAKDIFLLSVKTFKSSKFKNLEMLYLLAKIKAYIKTFFNLLDTEDFEKVTKDIKDVIFDLCSLEDKHRDFFLIYFLRELKEKYGSISKVESTLEKNPLFEWITCIKTDTPKSLLDTPIYSSYCKSYPEINNDLRYLLSNMNRECENMKKLDFATNPSVNESLCLAFCNEVYLIKHSEFFVQKVKKFIYQEKEFTAKTSEDTTNFLGKILNNFENYKLLQIDQNSSVEDIELASIITRVGSFFVSNCNGENAFSPLIENGFKDLHKNFEQFFPPGADDNTDVLQKYFSVYHYWSKELTPIIDNQIIKGRIYKIKNENAYPCRCSCGFLYSIGNCTNPVVTGLKCLDCKLPIGGEAYGVLHKRPGHTKIEIEEIKKIVQECFDNTKPGYFVRAEDFWNDEALYMRELSQIGYRILNLIFDSMIYMAIILTKDEQVFRKLLKVDEKKFATASDYLEKKINFYWKKLKSILGIKNDANVLMNIITNEFFELVKSTKPIKNNNDRIEFEKDFEAKVLKGILADMNNQIEKQKLAATKLNENDKDIKEKIDMIGFINQVTESDDAVLRYLKFMTSPKRGSSEELKEQFKTRGFDKEYPLLNVILDQEEKLVSLEHLYPIISFTNLLLSTYNFTITKADSTKKTIKDARNLLIQRGHEENRVDLMIKEFIIAWNAIKDQCADYLCHRITPKNVNEDTLLSFVLPYDDGDMNKEQGMSMLAAFENLGTLQNAILGAIKANDEIKSKYAYVNEVYNIPLQSATKSDIISVKELFTEKKKNLNSILDDFWLVTCIDGKYPKIIYDYRRLEETLARALILGKKILKFDEQSLQTAQFQFELNTHNNRMIGDFAERFGRESLTLDEREKLFNKFYKLSDSAMLKIYSSVENIIYYLLGSNYKGDTLLTTVLYNIPTHLDISEATKEICGHVGLSFEKLLDFHSIIEEILRDQLFKLIRKEYKTEIDVEITNKIDECITEFQVLTMKNISNAIRRFACRYLIGNYSPMASLGDILFTMPSLWDPEIQKENNHLVDDLELFLMDQYQFFPRDIKIIHTIQTYEYFMKKIQEEKVKKEVEKNLKMVANEEIRIEIIKENERQEQPPTQTEDEKAYDLNVDDNIL